MPHSMKLFRRLLFAVIPLLLAAQQGDPLLRDLRFRLIGPFRGGRSVAVAGVPSDPKTYYLGATGGGVWKTTDAGLSWLPISDGFFKTGSVGAIAVAAAGRAVVMLGDAIRPPGPAAGPACRRHPEAAPLPEAAPFPVAGPAAA